MEQSKAFEYAQGNPGAMRFLAQLSVAPNSKPFFDALEKDPTLRGTNIYILCSDLCKGDTEKIIHLCENCPTEILSDASSRQDRSGVFLVKDYMLN